MILFLLLLSRIALADGDCTTDLAGAQKLMGQKHQAATWVETTANDHKPLYIQIATKDKKLNLVFLKTREGIWAEGPATICPKEKKPKLLAKIKKEDLFIGKAAPIFVRMGFKGGADFTLTPQDDGSLKITTFGWGGEFVPSDEKALSEARAAIKD